MVGTNGQLGIMGIFCVTDLLETDKEIKLAHGNTVRESELNWHDIPNEPGFQSALVYVREPVESFEILKRPKPVIQ